jgi:ADP-heptose:LPS heptosyltransferase
VIARLAPALETVDLTTRTSLWEAAIVLGQCRVLLTNDSALGHIAEAVGTPVAILFGSTLESFGYAPYRERSRAFSTRLGCRPCSKDGATSCRYGDKLCFTGIDVPEVARYLAGHVAVAP